VNNRITEADIGIGFFVSDVIRSTGKYRDNLTFDVTTPYAGGGTDAGNNNSRRFQSETLPAPSMSPTASAERLTSFITRTTAVSSRRSPSANAAGRRARKLLRDPRVGDATGR